MCCGLCTPKRACGDELVFSVDRVSDVAAAVGASDTDADVRAREIEAQMTDDERFSLLISVMGANDLLPFRDQRIPPDVAMSAGYVPGIPRLGVPALRMSDASLGVTNPGYRPGDEQH